MLPSCCMSALPAAVAQSGAEFWLPSFCLLMLVFHIHIPAVGSTNLTPYYNLLSMSCILVSVVKGEQVTTCCSFLCHFMIGRSNFLQQWSRSLWGLLQLSSCFSWADPGGTVFWLPRGPSLTSSFWKQELYYFYAFERGWFLDLMTGCLKGTVISSGQAIVRGCWCAQRDVSPQAGTQRLLQSFREWPVSSRRHLALVCPWNWRTLGALGMGDSTKPAEKTSL